MIEKQPFKRYSLEEEEKPDIFTIRLNKEERTHLNMAKYILDQPKDSTALKTMAEVGYIILHDDLMKHILEAVFINKRNNQRTGAYVEYPTPETNVIQKNNI